MSVYRLTSALTFPSPHEANADGLVAIGGDLRPERLLLAYSQGIFPWPMSDDGDENSGRARSTATWPMLWFSPDPRYMLHPKDAHLSRRDRKALINLRRASNVHVTFDRNFESVIQACAHMRRPKQRGTWIIGTMIEAYTLLHRLGFAHSVEVYRQDALVGGLYGVSLGSAFFGESMFSYISGASKLAFFALARHLEAWGFTCIDCQIHSDHFIRWGARPVSRQVYLATLKTALEAPTRKGDWNADHNILERMMTTPTGRSETKIRSGSTP